MKTYVQPGHTLTITAPSGGVTSGHGVLIGTLFGIAQADAAEGTLSPPRADKGKRARRNVRTGIRCPSSRCRLSHQKAAGR
ncbi:MAG: DUF2190 family protein [Defluviicoccus sp.]